jgi:hypothetical protein
MVLNEEVYYLNKISLLIISVVFLYLSINFASIAFSRLSIFENEFFTISYPKGIAIKKETPVEDFDIYYFNYQKKSILKAYVGNHPSLIYKDYGNVKKERGNINGLNYEANIINDPKNNTETGEYIIKLNYDWPAFIHFWYEELDNNILNEVKRIITSVKLIDSEKAKSES